MPSTEVLEYVEREHRHGVLTGIGTLTSLEVQNAKGDKVVTLNAPDPREAKLKDVVQVAISEDGRQLYFVGGDQSIPLEILQTKFGLNEHDVRENMLIGEVTKLTYRTRKSFENGGKTVIDFWHKLGGEHAKHVLPVLEYKPRNPSMELVGGRYYVEKPSNKLGGVSPGIVG